MHLHSHRSRRGTGTGMMVGTRGGPDCNTRSFESLESGRYGSLPGCKPYGDGVYCRDFVLPFDSEVDIAAGAQATIEQNPQTDFVGKRLVIASTIAPSFAIDDFRVGKNSQFIAAGSIDAETFSEVGVGVALAIDPAGPGRVIVLVVTNTSGQPARFRAALIGNSVD